MNASRGCTLLPAAVLALVVLSPVVPVAAQGLRAEAPNLTDEQRALERSLRSELVCVCGNCPHLTLGTCVCPDADVMRAELTSQIALGKDREGVFQFFIDTYGSQEPLGAPIGAFNQLSWMFPLAVGAVVLGLIGRAVVRSARRDFGAGEPTGLETGNAALDARLDEELRNLD